ncbi:hypothetical protein ACBI99_05820 [Nonomuraea sp. ATR24]|nr:hypothetical protein [Nonomuraea ceibae]
MRTRLALTALTAIFTAVVAVGSNGTTVVAETSPAIAHFEVSPCC